jgi:small subunit ribosomal protein S20
VVILPNIKSAKKRMRQSIKRRERNFAQRSKIRTYMKKANNIFSSSDKQDEKDNILSITFSVLDKAAKKGVIHSNKAARLKSKLSRKAKV